MSTDADITDLNAKVSIDLVDYHGKPCTIYTMVWWIDLRPIGTRTPVPDHLRERRLHTPV